MTHLYVLLAVYIRTVVTERDGYSLTVYTDVGFVLARRQWATPPPWIRHCSEAELCSDTWIDVDVMASEIQLVKCYFSDNRCKQHVAQLSQRDRAAGWASFGQKWKTGTGIQYSAEIIGLSSTTVM